MRCLLSVQQAEKLGTLLDGEHHRKWCGLFPEDGLAAIDQYVAQPGIPLRTASGWRDEGWVSVEVQYCTDEWWAYLELYIGRSGILFWKNCD